MSIGSLTALRAILAKATNPAFTADEVDFYLSDSPADWEARTTLVGTGHCVPLVQSATGAPVTGLWCAGPKVRCNGAIPFGTAIATFNSAGAYASARTGNHAAIFLEETTAGLVVIDQWQAKTPARPSRRTLSFRGGVGSASNDGDQFSVILTRKVINSAAKAGSAWLRGYA